MRLRLGATGHRRDPDGPWGRSLICVTGISGGVVLSVRGGLDAGSADLLQEVVSAGLAEVGDPSRIKVDVRSAAPCSPRGLAVLAELVTLGVGIVGDGLRWDSSDATPGGCSVSEAQAGSR